MLLSVNAFSQQKFSQKLEWKADRNVLEYKVEIQNTGTGKSQFIKTEKNFVSLSLEPGKYRYKIQAYNFLGQKSVESSWINFEVLKAAQPVIEKPVKEASIAKDSEKLELDVSVNDVSKDSVVELVNQKTGEKIKGELVLDKKPASKSEVAQAKKIQFDKVKEGEWKLKITNPSGLSTVSEGIKLTAADKTENIAEAQKTEIPETTAAESQPDAVAVQVEEAEKPVRLSAADENEKARTPEESSPDKAVSEEIGSGEVLEKSAEPEKTEKAEEIPEPAQTEYARSEGEKTQENTSESSNSVAENTDLQENDSAEEEKKPAPKKKIRIFSFAGGTGLASAPIGDLLSYSDDIFHPLASIQFDFIPVRGQIWKVGLETDLRLWTVEQSTDYYNLDVSMLQMQVDLIVRHRLKWDFLDLKVRAGGGSLMAFKRVKYTSDSSGVTQPDSGTFASNFVNAGLSFVLTPRRLFFMEAGLDAAYIPDDSSLLVVPNFCVGLRF